MKKYFAVAAAMVLALALVGCTDDVEITVNGGGDDAAPAAEETAYETAEYKVWMSNYVKPVDEMFADYNLNITYIIDGWEYPADASAAQFAPAPGFKHILISMEVSNPDDNTSNAVPARSELKLDFDGIGYSPVSFMKDHGREFEFPTMMDVAPGESASGDLLFELPADRDVKDATLLFTPTIETSWQTQTQLGELIDLDQF